MTSEFSGQIMCLHWGFGGLGSLDMAWPLVKQKSSSEVLGHDIKPRGRCAVWGSWGLGSRSASASGKAKVGLQRCRLGYGAQGMGGSLGLLGRL